MATRQELAAVISGIGHCLRTSVAEIERLVQKLNHSDDWRVDWHRLRSQIERHAAELERLDRRAQPIRQGIADIEEANRDHLRAESFREFQAVATATELLCCIAETVHRELSEIWDDDIPWVDDDEQHSATAHTVALLAELPVEWLNSLIVRAEAEMLRYDPWVGWQSTDWYANETGRSTSGIRSKVSELLSEGLADRVTERGNINLRQSAFERLKLG